MHRSPQEVFDGYKADMGPELGQVFYRMWNDCSWLHLKWHEYREVFGTSQERYDLLNKAAPGFFAVISYSLWEDVLMNICRFTDPPNTKYGQRLSLGLLPPLVAAGTIRSNVELLVEEAQDRSQFARDWRNRQIAHRDRLLALEPLTAKPIAPASRHDVQQAINAIAATLGEVEAHYCRGARTGFELVNYLGDGVSLLKALELGVAARGSVREIFE